MPGGESCTTLRVIELVPLSPIDRASWSVCIRCRSLVGWYEQMHLRALFGLSAARVEMNKGTTSFALQRASMSPIEGHQPAFTKGKTT